MGIIKKIFEIPSKMLEFQKNEQLSKNIDADEQKNTTRRSIPTKKIDQMQRIEASTIYKNRIYKKFYSDYPEKPFISQDRELNTNWIEQAEKFPKQCIIPKPMMTRFSDGLLPGHVYMLYWLKKYTNKRIPAYFEYKYGIDFEKEKKLLIETGLLNSDLKPTEKGNAAIIRHNEIIEKHNPPKSDLTIEEISKQILSIHENIKHEGFKEFKFVASKNSCDICKRLDGKIFRLTDFEIGVNAPPMHEKCRCSIAAYENSEDYEAWLDFLDKGGTTKEWKKATKKYKQ